jgi:hypothetical protein
MSNDDATLYVTDAQAWRWCRHHMREATEPYLWVLPIRWKFAMAPGRTSSATSNAVVPFVPLPVRPGGVAVEATELPKLALSCHCLLEKMIVYHLVTKLAAFCRASKGHHSVHKSLMTALVITQRFVLQIRSTDSLNLQLPRAKRSPYHIVRGKR